MYFDLPETLQKFYKEKITLRQSSTLSQIFWLRIHLYQQANILFEKL